MTARRLLLLLPIAVLAAAIAVFLTTFAVLRVREISMEPTLVDGQWVLIHNGKKNIEYDDLVVYRSPEDQRLVVKRCILKEGDPLSISNGWLQSPSGTWFLTGSQNTTLSTMTVVPENHVFLAGDNQFHSVDSRDYGAVPLGNVIGEVVQFRRGWRRDG